MFAGVLKNLGTKRAFIVHGADGLDEATVTGQTRITELREGAITTYNLDPIEFFGGVSRGEELLGGDVLANAQITKDVLTGTNGACRNIVLLNAALAIVAGGKAHDVREGIAVASDSIDSGAALRKLKAMIDMSNA